MHSILGKKVVSLQRFTLVSLTGLCRVTQYALIDLPIKCICGIIPVSVLLFVLLT